jgi:hypothetical protein
VGHYWPVGAKTSVEAASRATARCVASAGWASFVSHSPSWLPNHRPVGSPLSPPAMTCVARIPRGVTSPTKRREGPPPKVSASGESARGSCGAASTVS